MTSIMFKKCVILFTIFLTTWVKAEESIFVVNSKRPLHVVSDKFLSISIDPAVLLTKINLSDVSLQMARHLSPAYVRIAGPSTGFVRYVDTDDKSKETEDADSITVTPSVWFAINEWFNMANLTPVFGINDADTSMGVWNPKAILPLLEISDKFNLTCLWQLGFDCSNKTDSQYLEDLRILRHILDAFPDRKNTWKIVGSNIRKCTHKSGCRKLLDSLKGITDYVTWEQSGKDRNMLNDELAHIIFGERKNPKLWTSLPRNHNPPSFETALEWAKEVGQAGSNGFDVIFRTPRVYEFFVDTPVFWFSLLYKTLVGNIVLDMKSASSDSKLDAFAYCAKHQNDFNQRGAMVLMIVNQNINEKNVQIKLSALAKNMEIQSYILTSKSDTRSIYLNGEKLKSTLLNQDPLTFIPKLRRAKPSNGLLISVPAKSIGFFVLPGARVTACMDEDDEMALLMEEIESDQELPISEELAIEVQSRSNSENIVGLKGMEKLLQEELENDEKFFLTTKKEETHHKLDDILEDLKDDYEKDEDQHFHVKIDEEARKKILERAKLVEAHRKLTESEQRLVDLSRMILSKPKQTEKERIESAEEFDKPSKTEKPKVDATISKNNHPKFTFPKLNSFHLPESKRHTVGKMKSLHDQLKEILNLPTINSLKHPIHEKKNDHTQIEEFEVPKLNSIHHDEFPKIDDKKMTLSSKNLQEHFRDILAKKNQFKKPIMKVKEDENTSEIELELTSEEVKKVLADRVKARAAKTNVRFTNEELTEIMKKATEKLKHDHTLKARGGIKSRLKRDINMKLLNEASRHKLPRKDPFNSEESVEYTPKKKISTLSKNIIVNPLYKKSKVQNKKSEKTDSSTVDSSEIDDDFELYFEDEFKDSKKSKVDKQKVKNYKTCMKKKIASGTSKEKDFEEEDEHDKKYLRLEEYFKNAKEAQKKFDDIDFSDEDDYSNLEDDAKSLRKRENKRSTGCSCSHLLEDIMDSIRIVIKSGNESDFQSLKNKLENYDEVINKTTELKTQDEKRRRRSVVTHQNYRPICEAYRRWRPEDILSWRPRNILQAKKTVMIDDLSLYKHLLRRNDIKRSLRFKKKENELLQNSDESLNSVLNRIDKDEASENLDNQKDFELVFPHKNKLEIKSNENSAKIIFEHPKKSSNFSTGIEEKITNTPKKDDKKILFHKESSNIQVIPKNRNETFFHNAFDHFHSLIHRIGSKIKSYFDNIFQ